MARHPMERNQGKISPSTSCGAALLDAEDCIMKRTVLSTRKNRSTAFWRCDSFAGMAVPGLGVEGGVVGETGLEPVTSCV